MKFELLSQEHYRWLINIAKHYIYENVYEALQIIREFQRNKKIDPSIKWVNETKLKRNHYWILSSLLEKYKYNDVLNSLANIYR